MDTVRWLKCVLMIPGTHETKDVSDAAIEKGISAQELRQARIALGVKTTNNWSREHPADKWFWSLPEDKP